MSKVTAYRCDICKSIQDEESIVGIKTFEDLFEKLKSFPVEFRPEKSDIHVCTDCFRSKVFVPASNMVDRKVNERGYELKVQELSYGLRAQAVHNVRVSRRKK